MIRQAALLLVVSAAALVACDDASSEALLPLDQCFPGVWRIGPARRDCSGWCEPTTFRQPTSECAAPDCQWMEIVVLRQDGIVEERMVHVSYTLGHFSSVRWEPTRSWEVDGDYLVVDVGEVTEGRYEVLECTASSVEVDAEWVTGVTRYWERLEDELAVPAVAASESGMWTDVPIAR